MYNTLTEREKEVLQFINLNKYDIARRLNVSANTIQTHQDHIYSKRGVTNRADAVVTGLQQGLISLDKLEIKERYD